RPLVDIRDGQTPARAVTDVFADLVAAVRDAVHDLLDALLREPRQLMVGERAACNGHECLRQLARLRAEPRRDATGKDDALTHGRAVSSRRGRSRTEPPV